MGWGRDEGGGGGEGSHMHSDPNGGTNALHIGGNGGGDGVAAAVLLRFLQSRWMVCLRRRRLLWERRPLNWM